MGIAEVIAIAVGLAIDAMCVAIAASLALGKVSGQQIFRFAFHFGLFQGIMPIIGWFLGIKLLVYIEAWDHWVAFFLLAGIGVKAIIESFKKGKPTVISDPTKGLSLIVLSIATSIDALVVSLNFGFMEMEIWTPAIVIALVTALLTTVGMLMYKIIKPQAKQFIQIGGGVILIAIGAKILISHIMG